MPSMVMQRACRLTLIRFFKMAGYVVDVYYNSTYTGLGPDDSSLIINSDLTSGEINLRLTLYQMPERESARSSQTPKK